MTDDRRTFVHGLWSSVAPNWIERADYLEERGRAVTKTMLDRAAIAPTDRVLALADGPGGMALAVAPNAAEVVSSDVVPAFADAAEARARAAGWSNVRGAVIDIEEIALPDASFDAVVSREGLMFAVDPQRAFDEIARVLRPGGRLAAAVWGTPAANPWLAITMEVVSDIVGHPVPPVGMPGPFALCDEGALRGHVAAAGLVRCEIDAVDVPFHAPSFDAWVEHTTALAGPVANIVNGFDAATRASYLDKLRSRVSSYESTDGLDFPGVSLVVSATRD